MCFVGRWSRLPQVAVVLALQAWRFAFHETNCVARICRFALATVRLTCLRVMRIQPINFGR